MSDSLDMPGPTTNLFVGLSQPARESVVAGGVSLQQFPWLGTEPLCNPGDIVD